MNFDDRKKPSAKNSQFAGCKQAKSFFFCVLSRHVLHIAFRSRDLLCPRTHPERALEQEHFNLLRQSNCIPTASERMFDKKQFSHQSHSGNVTGWICFYFSGIEICVASTAKVRQPNLLNCAQQVFYLLSLNVLELYAR